MKRELEFVRDRTTELWRRPPQETPVEWMERSIHLPSRVTNSPGLLNFDRCPYWREPLNTLSNPEIEDLVLVAGSQTGKTTAAKAATLWGIKHLQVPALIVMPSTETARSFSESRLQPTIEESPQMAELKPKSSHRYKLLEMHFATATLNLVGANSPSNLASRPLGFLVMDETDKFPEKTKEEAAAILLALERTKTYPLRKHVITSTPTYAHKAIWEWFQQGDQNFYYVPSPYTKGKWLAFRTLPEYDIVTTKSGRIDIGKSARTARVLCPHTGKPILDGDKYDLLTAGRWQPDNPDATKKTKSYHCSTLYSLDYTWEQIVTKYLLESTKPFGTQNFTNSWLGLPYEPSMDQEQREIPTGGYTKLSDHGKETVRVVGVDVQKDHFWAVCRCLTNDKDNPQLRLIDERRLETYEDIEAFREEMKVEPDLVGIDCAYNSETVKAQAAKYGWTCLNGVTERAYFWHQDPGQDRIKRISAPANSEPAYHAGGTLVPVIQYASQRGEDLLEFAQGSGIWTTADDTSKEYQVHLRSHKRVRKVRKGRTIYVWEQIKETPDHLYDCEVMSLVLIDALDMMPTTPDINTQLDEGED